MEKMIRLCILFLSFAFGMAQEQNQEVVNGKGDTLLLGPITLERLREPPYSEWFYRSYDSYAVDSLLVTQLKERLLDHQIIIYLGTWCSDSQRQVPRFVKILNTAEYPLDRLRFIALDNRKGRYKTSPDKTEKKWGIKRVPTFILLRDGKEHNRIVERPVNSLEEDLLDILSDMEYIPLYSQNRP